MAEHIQEIHAADMGGGQVLPLALKLTERSVAEDFIDRCPLCPMKLQTIRLLGHIAEHFEEISLFALPCQLENASDSSIDSNDARGKGIGPGSEDSLSSVFSFKSQDDVKVSWSRLKTSRNSPTVGILYWRLHQWTGP